MSNLHIRPAALSDVACIHQFIVDLATYEREPDAVLASEDDIRKALFCDSPRVFALICERQDPGSEASRAIGFAIYFFNFSTWLGRHGIYLEDLYVTPEARGAGAGRALLRAVARQALENDCGRFEWSVLKWNTPSIAFYEACGARALDEWVGYRMDRATIEAFATAE